MLSQKISKLQDSISAEHKGGDLTESNIMRSGGEYHPDSTVMVCACVWRGGVLPDSTVTGGRVHWVYIKDNVKQFPECPLFDKALSQIFTWWLVLSYFLLCLTSTSLHLISPSSCLFLFHNPLGPFSFCSVSNPSPIFCHLIISMTFLTSFCFHIHVDIFLLLSHCSFCQALRIFKFLFKEFC